MNIIGIVAEYNPFHNGHLYHIQNTKKLTNCDGIIAVMSGNFVQRGLPSIIDKWNRTKICLLNGIDLVIELPVLYSVSSAEFFSYGAVSLLNSLGVVNGICFGNESTDIKLLELISNILLYEPAEFKNQLKCEINSGTAYAKARNSSLIKFLSENYNINQKDKLEYVISSSNNILAIEYIKSLKKLKSNINIFSIKRQGENYNSLSIKSKFSSASAIRNFLKTGDSIYKIKTTMPKNTYNLLKKLYESNYNFSLENLMVPYLKYKYISNKNSILNLPDVSEGIENRIFKSIENNDSYDGIIKSSKTKRYAYSRISRILCQFFLGFENFNTEKLRKNPCPYARVLGFNSTGRKILREIGNKSSIPVYTRFPKNVPSEDTFALDILSTRAYSLLNNFTDFNLDYKRSPIVLKN
ncbi:nucleotidyltransferase [Clostridium sp.]|jgi:predicted nucleotidyltransferase|uniref:nucleotidyltransferase n=1 Tax=Clostridium sp. TaxID=1506 RepID=UPI003A5C2C7A